MISRIFFSGGSVRLSHMKLFSFWRSISLGALLASTLHAQDSGYVFSALAGRPFFGSADGTGRMAGFSFPKNLAVDRDGNVIVSDSANHTLRKVTRAGVVTTLAGLAGVPGSADGTGAAARF